jgi:hypothetical protein
MYAANLKEAFVDAPYTYGYKADQITKATAAERSATDSDGRSYTQYVPLDGTRPIPRMNHMQFVNQSAGKFNMVANLTSPMKNVFERTGRPASEMTKEVNNVIGTPGIGYDRSSYELGIGLRAPNVTLNYRNDVAELVKFCEAKKDTLTNPFSDPKFLANCGVCFKNGKDHTENPEVDHLGGLFLYEQERSREINDAKVEERRPRFAPSIGKCEPGYFAGNSDAWQRLKNRITCETSPSYDVPGCVTKFDNDKFVYIDDLSFMGPSLLVKGKGKLLFQNASLKDGNWSMVDTRQMDLTDSYQTINIKNYINSASTSIALIISNKVGVETTDQGVNDELSISIVVTGPTPVGRFLKDMTPYLIDDTVSRPARFKGVTNYESYRMNLVKPHMNTQGMSFTFAIPFSFIDASLPDAPSVGSSAVISNRVDAGLLNKGGACYKADQAPGAFSDKCVGDLFDAAGCTPFVGTGDPRIRGSTTTAEINSENVDLDKISDKFIEMSSIAKTGRDLGGAPVGIERWNEASMFCLGKPIQDSCALDNLDSGPISERCLIDMYKNKFKRFNVYKMGTDRASLDKEGKTDTYCTVNGTESPVDAQGKVRKDVIDKLQVMGGAKDVAKYFDQLHKNSLDETLPLSQRDSYFMACFGKNADIAKAAGVAIMGRYVRLETPDSTVAQCLAVQQLLVLDTNGVNVALRKGVTMNKPGSGSAVPASAVSGAMSWEWRETAPVVDNCSGQGSYFEVDLGKDTDLSYVFYFNQLRKGFKNSKGMKIKVLNTRREVVAETVAQHTLAQSFRLLRDGGSFLNDTSLLLKNNMPIMLRAQSASGKPLYINTDPRPAAAGNINIGGTTGVFVSTIPDFLYPMPSPVRNPGESKRLVVLRTPFGAYLRHQGFVMKAHSFEGTSDLYRNDATFEVITPGVKTGATGTASFRSVNYPDRYISMEMSGDNFTGRVVLVPRGKGMSDFIIEPVNIPMEGRDSEVFNATANMRNYSQTPQQAEELCADLGGRVATVDELTRAQREGATWCSSGWTKAASGDYKGLWPMQSVSRDVMGCGRPYSVNEWLPSNRLANATCIAPKPPVSIYNAPNTYFENSIMGGAGRDMFSGYYSQNDKPNM